jgi:cell division septum initiation protein DivIVA
MSAPEANEIRECYRDYKNEWQEIRSEAATDMRFVLGDPWDKEDRAQRKDAGRPCLSLDELGQYLNQYINNLRQNRRAIQTTPKGFGANDEDAKKRSNLIMGIEERSNAQLAYINAGQCAVERSYGYAVIRTDYKDFESFDQEILIKPILNPDAVLLSPHYKQPDASDVPDGFLLDLISKKEFRRLYPKAKIQNFTEDELSGIDNTSDWIKQNYVQRGEFWRIEYDTRKLLLVQFAEAGPEVMWADDYKDRDQKGEVKRERDVQKPRVVQYMTNGLELLDEVPWHGTRVPICACFGKESWITEGGKAERRIYSMTRLARDPQMLYAYLATQECELAGMVPKVPFVGAVGQFDSDQETWEELNKVPHAYVEYDIITDATGQAPLPAPARPAWEPNFQQYEIAKDSARRAIQAAMGITPLPTAAQRQNEKSGVALEKIQTQEAIGSFHFTDNFDRFIRNVGWQINELITPILDTKSQIAISKPDGNRSTMQLVGKTSHPIDEQGGYDVQGLDADHLHTAKGEFDVTISTGPSYQSEREKSDAFADTMLENWQALGLDPVLAKKILALTIKLKDLGPIGDEIAALLNPPDPNNLPPEAQAAIAQLQGQLQAAQQELQALHMDRAGRVLEQQTKMALEQMKQDNENLRARLNNDIKVLLAEISTKSQDEQQRQQMYYEFWKENHTAAHDVALQKDDQAHQAGMAQQAQLAAAAAAQQQPDGGQPGGAPGGQPGQ